MGRKIYTSSSLEMCIANQQALLSKYNFFNWTAMSTLMDKFPELSREEFMAFIAEGCMVAQILLQSALDMADAVARIIMVAVTTSSASWLQNSGIAPDMLQTIEDLPFDGWVLFLEKPMKPRIL